MITNKQRSSVPGTADTAAGILPDYSPARTVFSETLRELKFVLASEESGYHIPELKNRIAQGSDLALGRTLTDGVRIVFNSGKPELHLDRAPLQNLIKHLKEVSQTLSACIDSYQALYANTPSKAALRVFSVALQRLSDDREGKERLRLVIKDALEIDLKHSRKNDWKEEVCLNLHGSAVKLELSLSRRGPASRLLSRLPMIPVPDEDRRNRLSYEIKLGKERATESSSLTTIKNILRMIPPVGATVAPMAITVAAASWFQIGKYLPKFSSDPILQNSLEFGTMLVGLSAVGALGARALKYLAQKKFPF